jgi:hypothetical protein
MTRVLSVRVTVLGICAQASCRKFFQIRKVTDYSVNQYVTCFVVAAVTPESVRYFYSVDESGDRRGRFAMELWDLNILL